MLVRTMKVAVAAYRARTLDAFPRLLNSCDVVYACDRISSCHGRLLWEHSAEVRQTTHVTR